MANQKHLTIINQGVKAWNDCVYNKSITKPDLRGADLSGKKLDHVLLLNANLQGANFDGASLIEASIYESNLAGASLANADLTNASLYGSNLTGADLTGANLKRVILTRAVLTGANLSGADFTLAMIQETVFDDTDLSGATGLHSVGHWGPSALDAKTIYKSRGSIPVEFLRWAGVPITAIEKYLRFIPGQLPTYYSCFISYASKDQQFANKLYASLAKNGVDCWFAPKDLKTGDRLRQSIPRSIREHDKLLVIISQHSIGSGWVESEVETALREEREQKRTLLFPVRLDGRVTEIKDGWAAEIYNTRHIEDFSRWENPRAYQRAFRKLLTHLEAEYAGAQG